jgi:hypothetical protein
MKFDEKTMINDLQIFVNAVHDSYAFLETIGFKRSLLRPGQFGVIVRYQSPLIYVDVTYGPPQFEPQMLFGRIGVDDREDAFSFEAGDLIQVKGCVIPALDSIDEMKTVRQVRWLAALLKSCAADCLKGEDGLFNEMKSRRDVQVKAWIKSQQEEDLLRKLDQLWSSKKYAEFLHLAINFDDSLSVINIKRKILARKYLNKESK